MDINNLLSRHQIALYNQTAGASPEERQWASHCASFYADKIGKLRRSFDLITPFVAGGDIVTTHG